MVPRRRALEGLDDALDAAGRDRGSIDRYLSIDSGGTYSLSSPTAADDAAGRAAELGFTDVILHWPRDGEPYEGTEKALDSFAERHLRRTWSGPSPTGSPWITRVGGGEQFIS